ncbi:MAG: eL32 family ribosomal protein [Nanoarchaeota archaeon]
MKNKSELLELRNKMKKKKPVFLRQEAHKHKKLEKNWRKPKGIHSKMREKRKGKRRQPSMGFSSPRAVRGLTKEGFEIVRIHNQNGLDNIKIPFYLAGGIGLRKKLEILKKAVQLKLRVLNVKNPELLIKNAEEMLKLRKTKKKEETQKKQNEQAEVLKKKEAEKKEKEETPEEKEKREKEEKRKVLEGKA